MALYSISGVGDGVTQTSKEISVPVDRSIEDFMVLVNGNYFGLKTILNSDQYILHTKVKQWFNDNGGDFNQLLLILNA